MITDEQISFRILFTHITLISERT